MNSLLLPHIGRDKRHIINKVHNRDETSQNKEQ